MTRSDSVVRSIDDYKKEMRDVKSATVEQINAGFSNRLLTFIGQSDIDIPKLDEGMITYIAKLFETSKPAASDWLTKNKPPKEATLLKIVKFFLNHIEGGDNILVTRVISWLRYGDGAVPSPFKQEGKPEGYLELSPLAASLIVEEAKEIGLDASDYDLEKVLPQTVNLLITYDISDDTQVTNAHRDIIRGHIKNNRN